MRIAVFHELHKGGARKAADYISLELKKNNTVDLYYIDSKSDSFNTKFYTSVNFLKFESKKWVGHDWKKRLYKDTVELLMLYTLHKKIAKKIDRLNYDVVLIHPSQFTQAPFILRFLKTRKVYYCQEPLRLVHDPLLRNTSQGITKNSYEQAIRYIRKKIDRDNIRYAQIILANSNFSQEQIKKAYDLESTVCYLGVDSKYLIPSKKRRDIDILYIGSESKIEGWDFFSSIRESFAIKYKIMFLNTSKLWVSEDELKEFYQRSKIVLCLSRSEPFGLIPLEAGSCGCVTIALNRGGYRESVLNGATGFLVTEAKQIINKKIDDVLSSEKLFSAISVNARKNAVTNWKWSTTASRLIKIIQSEEK